MFEKEEIIKSTPEAAAESAAEAPASAANEAYSDHKDTAEEKSKKKTDRDLKTEIKKLKHELDSEKKALAAKKEEYESLNDKYLRILAEYDNFRRRTQKERDSIYSDAYSDAVSLILPIYDNMERAAQFADNDKVSEGVCLLLKIFSDTLEKMGVTEIEAMNKKFDPELHNAVMHIEDANYGENEIIEVLQKGYCRDGKVIRYAMVKVAN